MNKQAHALAEFRPTRILFANKMWLTVGLALITPAGQFKLRGYVPESCLGTQQYWKTLEEAKRQSIEDQLVDEKGAVLVAALTAAGDAATAYVTQCTEEGLPLNMRKFRDAWSSGELNLATLPAALASSIADLRAQKRQRELAAQVSERVKLSDYPNTFPARSRARKLIAVLGPTNSGKTWEAFQRLTGAHSGYYLGPLRLLALEAFTRLNQEFGVVASLLTGEERRIVEGSRVTAATVEMMSPNKPVSVAVIDEIQMLSDPDRGWAWTQAVVGADADEVWMLGALSAEPALKALAARLGLPLEIRYKERKSPLVVGEPLGAHPTMAIQQARPGDAFIVFSRRDALNLRDDLLAQKKSVACIYGALSPEVREREAARFANGEADILVATDAIGLGLNLPIQRVVLTSVQKYNGEERTELPVPLLQQIAGRAGRYGHQSECGIVAGLTPAEHDVVQRLMRAKQEALPETGFQIAPSWEYLEKIADMAGDTRLEALLSLFLLHADCGDRFFTPYVPEEQLARAAELDALKNLTLSVKHIFSMAPMSSQDEEMDDAWRIWAQAANAGRTVPLTFLPGAPRSATLSEAETAVKLLSAYRWFGYRLPEIFVDFEAAEAELEPWVAAVDEHLRSKRKQGVGGGRAGMPSWYWGPAPGKHKKAA